MLDYLCMNSLHLAREPLPFLRLAQITVVPEARVVRDYAGNNYGRSAEGMGWFVSISHDSYGIVCRTFVGARLKLVLITLAPEAHWFEIM
ncbi:hypothetical protein BaRGS_00023164 [Batillaria attramentaria]|uniref:Uncharacterized protein n=1 Tax=Batillaria attramentaria TaxID=370345 RepID=A0ABD0KEQ4_9CAEN